MTYSTLKLDLEGPVARLWLDRPDVRNAFNAVMILELRSALAFLRGDDRTRVVVLSGLGSSFCAGADLNWMREIVGDSRERNLAESEALADFLEELYALPKPTIARVNGPAVGGGTGFLAACDIAVASSEATFGLSEVKIGLVPAVISPYVVRRIGETQARELFLTGERFDAGRALRIGLVNAVASPERLDERTDELAAKLLSSGPAALAKAKELLRVVPRLGFEEAKRFAVEMIADLRVSPEAQEGMAAFLEKRKPRWSPDV